MIRFIEMDENVTLADQLQKGGKDDGCSVIMINKFNVKPHDVRGLLEAWAADAAYLKQKQGFNYAQPPSHYACRCMFVNYPVWESVDYFNQATSDPAFRSALARYPQSTAASSYLFRKVAVRGICVN
jgi:hypothetical protein